MGMFVDRPLVDVENFTDLRGRLALRRPPQNFALTRRQRMVSRHYRYEFDDQPIAFSPRDCELMGLRHLQHLCSPAYADRVGAQYRHLQALEQFVELALVVAKGVPMIAVQPERVAALPHSVITFGQRAAQFLLPSAANSFEVEPISFEIPLAPRNDFHASGRQMPIESRDAPAQFRVGFLKLQWL